MSGNSQRQHVDISTLLACTPLAPIPISPLTRALEVPKVYATSAPLGPVEVVETENPELSVDWVTRTFRSVPHIEFEHQGECEEATELEALPAAAAEAVRWARKVTGQSPAQCGSDTKPSDYPHFEAPNYTDLETYRPKVSGALVFQPEMSVEALAAAAKSRNKKTYDTCIDLFLSDPNPRTLASVSAAAMGVGSEDLDVNQSWDVSATALNFLVEDPLISLQACSLILTLRWKLAHDARFTTTDYAHSVLNAFKSAVSAATTSPRTLAAIEMTLVAWSHTLDSGCLDEQTLLGLLNTAYQLITGTLSLHTATIFGRKGRVSEQRQDHLAKVKRASGKLVIKAFTSLPAIRNDIVHDLLLQVNSMEPAEQAQHIPISLRPGSESMQVISAVLIECVQITGRTGIEVWREATALKNKNLIERACKLAHNAAVSTGNVISRFLIEASKVARKADNSRLAALSIIEDIGRALGSPEWPGAELLISCVLARVFQASISEQSELTFHGYVFEILRCLQDSLFMIYQIEDDRTTCDAGSVIDYLRATEKLEACEYLAVRYCVFDSELYQEHYIRMRSNLPLKGQKVAMYTAKKMAQLHRSWPIGSAYEKIIEFMLRVTNDVNVSDREQTDVLRLLVAAVERTPTIFTRIQESLLAKLRTSGPLVCDWVAQVVGRYVFSENKFDDEKLLHLAVVRMAGPGVGGYKKRCIRLLQASYKETTLQSVRTLSWKYLLRASVDADSRVSEQAIDAIEQSFLSQSVLGDDGLKRLAETVLSVHNAEMPYPALLAHALRLILSHGNPSFEKRTAIQKLVVRLLGDLSVSTYTAKMVPGLAAAASILDANGLFLPSSKLEGLLAGATKPSSGLLTRLLCLKMLCSALTTQPRPIMSPKVAAAMFSRVVNLVQSYDEPELDHAGQILWVLAKSGNSQLQKSRQSLLEALTLKAQKMLESVAPAKLGSREAALQQKQLSHILSVAVRYWVPKDQVHPFAKQLVQILMKSFKTAKADEKLRLSFLRDLGRVLFRYPQLLVGTGTKSFLDSHILNNKDTTEWQQFMALLLEFLYAEETRAEAELLASKSSSTVSKKRAQVDLEAFYGTGAVTSAESTAAGIMQKFLPDLLERALAKDDATAAVATKLITVAVEANRVDVHYCVPTIVALAFSSRLEIASRAESCFAMLHEQWGATVAARLPEGFKLALATRAYTVTDRVVAHRLLAISSSGTKSIHVAMSRLGASLDGATIAYAQLLVEAIPRAKFEPRDAKELISRLEGVCFSTDVSTSSKVSVQKLSVTILLSLLRVVLVQQYDLYDETEKPEVVFKRVTSINVAQILRLISSRDAALELAGQVLDLPDFASEETVADLLKSFRKKRRT